MVDISVFYYLTTPPVGESFYPLFLYNKNADTFEQIDDICAKLNIEKKDFIPEDYDYIPLSLIPDLTVLREYIKSTNDKKIQQTFKNTTDSDLSDEFYRFFHSSPQYSFLLTDYNNFRTKFAKECLINWCKKNGIPYKDE